VAKLAYPPTGFDYSRVSNDREPSHSVARLFNPLRFVEFRVDKKSRQELTAQIAYFRAQRRGFEPGHEVEDWLAAEAELDSQGSR
jgi:hypothetical protein